MKSVIDSWEIATLKEVCYSYKGKKPKKEFKKKTSNELIPYINIQTFEKKIVQTYVLEEDAVIAEPGDILVVWDGARFGLTGITVDKGGVGSTLMCLKPYVINSRFLYHFLRSKYSFINGHPKGVATPHIDPEIFWNIEVPLPSVAEQSEIVNLIDNLIKDIAGSQSNIDSAANKLRHLKSAILNEAITGNLGQPSNSRIDQISYSFPKNWEQLKLEDVSDVIDPNPKHRNPRYIDKGFYFLSTANFSDNDGWDFSNTNYVEEEVVVEQQKRCNFNDKTMVFSRKGTIGKVRFTPKSIRFALLDSLVVINPNTLIDHQYLNYCLKSKYVQDQVEELIRGVALKQISVGAVRSLIIPLPPLEEQKAIVIKLEEAMSSLQGLETHINNAVATIKKIPMSLYDEAFSGELTKEWRIKNITEATPENDLLSQIQVTRSFVTEERKSLKKKVKQALMNGEITMKKTVLEVLEKSLDPLSSQELFKLAGYPSDASSSDVEEFFLEIKHHLLQKAIKKERRQEQDFFSIAK